MFREAARNGCFIIKMNTTALSKSSDILEVSALKCIYKNKKYQKTDIFHTFVNPGRHISDKLLEKVHVEREKLKESPDLCTVFYSLKRFLGDKPFLICYSDFSLLKMEQMYDSFNNHLEPSGTMDLKEVCKDILCEVDTPDYKFDTMRTVFGIGMEEETNGQSDVCAELSLMNVLLEKLKEDDEGTLEARVYGISYLAGFRGMSRIYVNTTRGTLFYDCVKDKWMPKEKESMLVKELNMQGIENQVFQLAGCSTYQALKKFRGEAGYERSNRC